MIFLTNIIWQVLDLLRTQSKLDKKFIEILPGEQSTVETDILPQATTQAGKFDLTQAQQSDQSAEDNSNTIWESVQEMVLVVASLIATVTYQAGLSPPQTIWKGDKNLDSKCIFHRSNSATNTCPSATYYLFMSFNTAGFFSCFPHILLWKQNLCESLTTNCPNLHDDNLYNTISLHVDKWSLLAYCILDNCGHFRLLCLGN